MVLRELFFRLFLLASAIQLCNAQCPIPNRFDYLYMPNDVLQIEETSARYGSKAIYNYDANGCIASEIHCERDGHIRKSVEYESEVLSDNVVRIHKKGDDITTIIYHHSDRLDSVSMRDGLNGIETLHYSFEYNDSGNLTIMEWQTSYNHYSCSYEYHTDTIICKERVSGALRETRKYIYTSKHELKQIIVENADKDAVISDVVPWDYNHLYMYSLWYRSFDKHSNWTKSYFLTKKRKVLRSKRKIKYKQ